MRNKDKFQRDIKKIIKDAEVKAIKASYANVVNEDDSVSSIATKMANHVSKAYSNELGPKLSKAIDDYLDSLEFEFALASPSGPVTGIIKIKP